MVADSSDKVAAVYYVEWVGRRTQLLFAIEINPYANFVALSFLMSNLSKLAPFDRPTFSDRSESELSSLSLSLED